MSRSVAIIGLGRVGLPLALVFAEKGFDVFGLDVNASAVEELLAGRMPFLEEGGEELLRRQVNKGFRPSTDPSGVASSEYVVLTLGTPVDENMNPDLSQIDQRSTPSAPYLYAGQTLILCLRRCRQARQVMEAKLEDELGLSVGTEFFLAFCPERIAEGRALQELGTIPQIVGGISDESTTRAAAFFRELGVECLPTDDVSAELAKLFTNMYRYISFAIANEFMIIAGQWKRDVNHVVNLVNHGYKRGGLALPGFSAGPCMYKDGFFLINQIPFTELISTSWKINESVPLFLVAGLTEKISLRNKRAVILGAAFKADSDDPRQSLSYKVRKALLRERAKVTLHDPFIAGLDGDLPTVLKGADVVFVATNHSVYTGLGLEGLRAMVGADCLVCDIWDIFGTDQVMFTLDEALSSGQPVRLPAGAPG